MRFRLLPLAVVMALLVAACGGSSAPKTKKTTTSHKAATSHKSSTVAATTSTSSANTGSVSKTISTTTTPTFANVSNCTNLSGVGEQFAKAMASATTGGKFNLNAAVKAYQDLANAAPGAIRSDVQVIASAFSAYASALAKAHYTFGTVPSASQIAALEQAGHVFSEAKLRNASKAIEAWAVKNCTVG